MEQQPFLNGESTNTDTLSPEMTELKHEFEQSARAFVARYIPSTRETDTQDAVQQKRNYDELSLTIEKLAQSAKLQNFGALDHWAKAFDDMRFLTPDDAKIAKELVRMARTYLLRAH